ILPGHRHAVRGESPRLRPSKGASSRQQSRSVRGSRGGSRGFPSIDGRFDIADDPEYPLQPSNKVVLGILDRHQFSDRLSAFRDEQRLPRGADVFHQCETVRLEFPRRNLLHGHIIAYMVIYRRPWTLTVFSWHWCSRSYLSISYA